MCKVKLNDNKVGVVAERGIKKILLLVFKDTYTRKLKYIIKLYAGIAYFTLINHLWETYHKLYQLNILELLANIVDYFDINNSFTRYIEIMKEAQKIATTVDCNLSNDTMLLWMGIEAMCNCGLFEKALDK